MKAKRRARPRCAWLGRAVTTLAGGLAAAVCLAAPPADGRLDELLRLGYDRPDQALAAMPPVDAGDVATRRQALFARGLVLAQSGRDAEAQRWSDALRALGADAHDAQAEAAAEVVRAEAAFNDGRLDVAARLGRDALDRLAAACPHAAGAWLPMDMVVPPAAACDHRVAWQALRLVQQHAARSGAWAEAADAARRARELAAEAGDDLRLALSTADAAWLIARAEGLDAAQPVLQQAQRLVARSEDPWRVAVVRMAEARMAAQRLDHAAVQRLAEEALPLARRAGSPRLEASVLTFVSDAAAKLGRPADALQAAERGLPIVRRHRDRRTELILMNNAGLAKIGLHRIAEGKRDLARVEELAEASGLTALRAEALREFDEALAAAGDAAGALELFHRERALSAEVMRVGREALLKTLRARDDRERQQRAIELLARDDALKSAELANHALLQRVWAAAVLLIGLATVVVALLYRRLRRTQRDLVSSQARLRVQSERDPLTNLSNRRHFLAMMNAPGARGGAVGFEGALLVVDIDHFKHVNDGFGHAAGDAVLLEVARRLEQAVRGDDLVVRWGGEEFLVLAPNVPASHAEALAERVLALVGEAPVVAEGREVPVTVSIGYAHFPLPPGQWPVTWEQAVNLADMALYTAKNQGRNRAVGIVAAQAEDSSALRRIEADFDRAWHEGRVTLRVAPGPLVAA